jgi:hypothetical protein
MPGLAGAPFRARAGPGFMQLAALASLTRDSNDDDHPRHHDRIDGNFMSVNDSDVTVSVCSVVKVSIAQAAAAGGAAASQAGDLKSADSGSVTSHESESMSESKASDC